MPAPGDGNLLGRLTYAAVFTWDYLAGIDALSRSTDGLVLTGAGRPAVSIRVF